VLSRRRIAFSRVIYTSGFFFLTVAFALIAVVALTLRFAGGTQVLKVAVGPADGDNAKLIGAIARHLERDGGRIRFVVLPVDDLAQSTKALEQGRADLAVIQRYRYSAERRDCRHFAQRHCRPRRAGRLHHH
jgi:ABC-type metal ion transport system substrate-binding protein